MSQAPLTATDEPSLNQHRLSWRAMMQLVRSGASWSGRERNCAFLNCYAMEPPALRRAAENNLPVRRTSLSVAEASTDEDVRRTGKDASAGRLNAVDRRGGGAITSFANVSAVSGLDFPDDGRAVAVVDWDQDGGQDLWFRNRTAPRLRLMRNRSRDLDGEQQFVSLKLIGTLCNRDAIGARAVLEVYDGSQSRQLVETVRAGDAFLSQSSRWLHFGLSSLSSPGPVAIRQVTVFWPGGQREAFQGLESGARYVLTQGTATALATKSRPPLRLAAQQDQPPAATAAARVVLPGKIPFPTLELLDAQTRETVRIEPGESPLIVTLWTSSCPNCRRELKDFSQQRERFHRQNIQVLAVCLDGLDAVDGTAHNETLANAADDYLREIHFPHRSATTTAESLERIQYFQQSLFDMHPDFVVPVSFLLDKQRNVVAIYRGAFGAEVLLADAGLADSTDASLHNLATPFRGSWFTKPPTPSELAEIVGRQLFQRDADEGLRFYELALQKSTDRERKSQLLNQLVSTHVKLAKEFSRASDSERATRHFREALRLAPTSAPVHHDFGIHLAKNGQFDEAESQLREALRQSPGNPTVMKSLEVLQQSRASR